MIDQTLTQSSTAIQLQTIETHQFLDWAAKIADSGIPYFEIGRQLSHRLGAHPRPDGLTEFGFWVPELAAQITPTAQEVYLEVFTPLDPVDWLASEQILRFRYDCVPVPVQWEFVWAVVAGLQVGQRQTLGSLYWLRYQDPGDGAWRTVRDMVPYSLPYGIFAPAELYDFEAMQRERADLAYLAQQAEQPPVIPAATGLEPALPRASAPVSILQIHVPTASEAGTLAGLTEIYRQIAAKLERGETPSPSEQNYIGYDAVQLLPTEPTIEFRSSRTENEPASPDFFAIATEFSAHQGPVCIPDPLTIQLRRPNTQNWGYDVPLLGSSTTNPALLSSLRPDEVIDFIATLHTFPGQPIQVIYDLVYGHADNQALELVSRQFLAGPNMYGQDICHTLPMVRALLLEMQRRKINTGVDGIRIDGGQDFRFFNPLSGRIEYDNAYLLAMSDGVQTIQGHKRLLFTIFEDGRPWPAEGWETTSTYRDLIELRPDAFQWGPLIFAHNTPTLKGFWDYKWSRVCEVMMQGDRWITGCANHDTVRRGNQIPIDTDINWNLGQTLPEVLNNAYDNPATTLWTYGFSPGLPMDFLNALMHSGWGFFRNTDDLYGVKVAMEELGFWDWQVTPALYDRPEFFPQLKQLGFKSLAALKAFGQQLAIAMEKQEYDLDQVAQFCQAWGTTALAEASPEVQSFFLSLDAAALQTFARIFMEEGHEFCRVSHYFETVDGDRSRFNLALRQYRKNNPWLSQNLSATDRFNRISEAGHTLFYGVRTQPSPAHSSPIAAAQFKQVAFLAHMGGEPAQTALADWLQLDLDEWRLAIASPGLELKTLEDLRGLVLQERQGLLLEHG